MVGIAPLDGDARADLFSANSGQNTISYWLQTSDGFSGRQDLETGRTPVCAVAADFDADGDADLAAVCMISNELWIWDSHGDGSFAAPQRLDTPTAPRWLVAADFDRDGHLDLAVACSGAASVVVFRGAAEASFTPMPAIDVGLEPRALAVGDFNSDAIPDLAVALGQENSLTVLRGLGNGAFVPERIALGDAATSVAAADVDGDNHIDLCMTLARSGALGILHGRAGGSFAPLQSSDGGGILTALVTGPFGPGNAARIAIANYTARSVDVFSERPPGSPGRVSRAGSASRPRALAAGDLTGDGVLDLAVASYDVDAIAIQEGNGHGDFAGIADFNAGNNTTDLVVGDFDLDGKPDVAVSTRTATSTDVTPSSGAVAFWYGTGTGELERRSDYPHPGGPPGLAIGDLNADGLPDLVVAQLFFDQIGVRLGLPDHSFGPVLPVPLPQYPAKVVIDNLDQDHIPDLLVLRGNGMTSWRGRGDGTFDHRRDDTHLSGPDFAVCDLNEDGNRDLLVAGSFPNRIMVRWGNPGGSLLDGSGPAVTVAVYPRHIIAGLLDADRHADVVLLDTEHDRAQVLFGDGQGHFPETLMLETGSQPADAALGDLNGDRHADLAIANRGSNEIWVYLARGVRAFAPAIRVGAGSTPTALAIADFDQDGRPDLVAGNDVSRAVSVLLDRERFAPAAAVAAFDAQAAACPQRIDARSLRPVTLTVYGTPDLDVRFIEPTSLRVGAGTPVRRVRYADVGAPEVDPDCACRPQTPDGFEDLLFEANATEIAASSGATPAATARLAAWLRDGTTVSATDCVDFNPVREGHATPQPRTLAGKAVLFPLPAAAGVGSTLHVYDVAGRRVASLTIDGDARASGAISWVPAGVPSGVYLYRITAAGAEARGRFVWRR